MQLNLFVERLNVSQILLRDLLDGNSDLGVEISGRVDHAVGAAAQQGLSPVVVQIVFKLGKKKKKKIIRNRDISKSGNEKFLKGVCFQSSRLYITIVNVAGIEPPLS